MYCSVPFSFDMSLIFDDRFDTIQLAGDVGRAARPVEKPKEVVRLELTIMPFAKFALLPWNYLFHIGKIDERTWCESTGPHWTSRLNCHSVELEVLPSLATLRTLPPAELDHIYHHHTEKTLLTV